ncbi:pyridoxal kinase isoform X2 [Copidosoma floridanum]|uniref:pyridoxal kinase isoform X2 n=1 Tax=Copidosoma floridanum TaxID=29053 RepID=UPI000C6F6C3D|nr:pyridoxal kinase isoform X2 [Copidosoma floridanum]
MSSPRVLSIQSHVVSGYVGNKSATFPLQLLGFEVDVINSVQLSNHTGYKVFKGQVLNDNDLKQLVDGLVQNDLDYYTHLLTGYIGSASFLKQVVEVVKKLKEKNPQLIYVCDPVMGDDGRMYVPEELKEIYQKEIVPLANIITPNSFELEILVGNKVNTISELRKAINDLHEIGPQIVAISSAEINGKLTSFVSTTTDHKMIKLEISKLPISFTGSGDLFAALFLAHTYLQDNIKIALENTINSLEDVLSKTYERFQTIKDDNAQRAKKVELCLIQSKKCIENPSQRYQATELN